MNAVNCLSDLIGIKSECSPDVTKVQYIENINGFSLTTLANFMPVDYTSAKTYAAFLINSAAAEMIGDLQQLIGSGYNLKETVGGELCSPCDFSASYQLNNAGVKLSNVSTSKYSELYVSTLNVVADYTGTTNLVFDDAKLIKKYRVRLESGVIMPMEVNYVTREKSVLIYFEDASIGVTALSCAQTSGCGCGGGSKYTNTSGLRISGILNGVDTSLLYGFKTCAFLRCNQELLFCKVISQLPNLFALTLLYKVGEKYYTNMSLSLRNNETRMLDTERISETAAQYTGLYREKMMADKGAKSIRTTLYNFMRSNNDACIDCKSAYTHAWAVG